MHKIVLEKHLKISRIMWYPYFFLKEHKYEFERIKTHLLNKIVKMCSY